MNEDEKPNVETVSVEEAPVAPESETPEQPKESKKYTFSAKQLSIGAFIAILIGVLAAFGVLNSDDSDNQAATETAESEEAADVEESDSEEVAAVTLASIEAQVKEGGVMWGDSLETVLMSYDQGNDNVSFTFSSSSIQVEGNGLPDHDTGQFPGLNPHAISEQDVSFEVPRSPVYVGTPTEVRTYGYSLGGIKIEPGTAETDSATGARIEAFNPSGVFNAGTDENNAHVQPDGTYHYHGLPSTLVTTGEAHSNIIGFAADGFPIYSDHGYADPVDSASGTKHVSPSWQLKSGARPSGEPSGTYNGDYTSDFEYVAGSGDLDECNGRFTVTPEFPDGTYAYFVTESFPFFGRCVMGEVVLDEAAGGGGGTAPGGAQQGPPSGGMPPR